MSNTATVQAIYEAFGRGDIPAILEKLDEDVRWDHWPHGNGAQRAGVPWMAERRGRADVANFFETLGELDITGFEVGNLLEGGDQVAAVVELSGTVKATGGSITNDEMHLWTFGADGLVTEFRHYIDTAQHAQAIVAEPTTTSPA